MVVIKRVDWNLCLKYKCHDAGKTAAGFKIVLEVNHKMAYNKTVLTSCATEVISLYHNNLT